MKKHKRKKSKPEKKQLTFEGFVKKTVNEIRTKCHFEDYEISFKVENKDKMSQDGRGGLAASITVDTRYMNAHINLYPALVRYYKQKDFTFVRQVLCHELAHIRTQKLFDQAVDRFPKEEDIKDSWESLTEQYGRLLFEKMNRKD